MGVEFPSLVHLHCEFVVNQVFTQDLILVVVTGLKMPRLLHRFVQAVAEWRVLKRLGSLHRQQKVVDIADVTLRENAPAEEIGFYMELALGLGL